MARDGASVSASVNDTSTGRALLAVDDTLVQPVASLGRVLLLIETAAQLEDGRLHGDRLQRMARDTATGAGLWQFLQEPTMQVPDLATLVGATADSWAMNALLSTVGIDAVRERAEALGIERTALIDRVRDRRGPDDAPDASVAPTGELAWLMRVWRARRGRRRSRVETGCSAGCPWRATCPSSRARSASTPWRTGRSTTACRGSS